VLVICAGVMVCLPLIRAVRARLGLVHLHKG